MTTKEDIRSWIKTAKESGHKYLIVVCDTFDYGDFPVYTSEDDFEKTYREYNGKNMCKIMEVYNLDMDIESQLNKDRCFNCPPLRR